MQKYLEKENEISFDKLFNQILGYLLFKDFCESMSDEPVPQLKFYEEVRRKTATILLKYLSLYSNNTLLHPFLSHAHPKFTHRHPLHHHHISSRIEYYFTTSGLKHKHEIYARYSASTHPHTFVYLSRLDGWMDAALRVRDPVSFVPALTRCVLLNCRLKTTRKRNAWRRGGNWRRRFTTTS